MFEVADHPPLRTIHTGAVLVPTSLTPASTSTLLSTGQAANRAAAAHLFADYHQRRAPKTIRTQTAALILSLRYLVEAAAADALLPATELWARSHLSAKERVALVQYAAARGVSLPIKYRARYAQSAPAAWQGVTWGLVEGFVKWLLLQGYSVASAINRLAAVKVYTRRMAKAGVIPPRNTLSSAKCVATGPHPRQAREWACPPLVDT